MTLFNISNQFSICTKGHISFFKCSLYPARANNFNLLNPWHTYALSPTIPDQNMTNLRCTADHHAVLRLNLRPGEGGSSPIIFQPVEKILPLTTTFQTHPRCISNQHTLSPIKPAHCRSATFSRAVDSWGWSALWCEGGSRLQCITCKYEPHLSWYAFVAVKFRYIKFRLYARIMTFTMVSYFLRWNLLYIFKSIHDKPMSTSISAAQLLMH